MAKLILMSVIVATVAIPAIAANDPRPRRAIRNLLIRMLIFNLIYLFLVTRVYPHVAW